MLMKLIRIQNMFTYPKQIIPNHSLQYQFNNCPASAIRKEKNAKHNNSLLSNVVKNINVNRLKMGRERAVKTNLGR